MLTAKQLAQRLGFDVRTIYRWTRAGRIPAVHFGRHVRYCWADVLAGMRRPSRTWHTVYYVMFFKDGALCRREFKTKPAAKRWLARLRKRNLRA